MNVSAAILVIVSFWLLVTAGNTYLTDHEASESAMHQILFAIRFWGAVGCSIIAMAGAMILTYMPKPPKAEKKVPPAVAIATARHAARSQGGE